MGGIQNSVYHKCFYVRLGVKKKAIQRTENILFDVCGGKCFPINCIIQRELWTTATRYTLRTKSIMSSNLFFFTLQYIKIEVIVAAYQLLWLLIMLFTEICHLLTALYIHFPVNFVEFNKLEGKLCFCYGIVASAYLEGMFN